MIASLLLLAEVATLASQPAPAFEAAQVPDPVLAIQRGGVRLPNGIDLALTVQTQTAVDGAVVLQTVFSIDRGPASLTIYAAPEGSRVSAETSPRQAWVAPAPMTPVVSYDPRTGLSVTQGYTGMPIVVGGGRATADSVPEGLQVIDPGAMPQTAEGKVSSQTDGLLRTVTLSAADFNVTHLSGAAFGSAIANSGSDRTIDTITGISIDLRNAGPDVLGSTFLRIDDLAAAAVGSRM